MPQPRRRLPSARQVPWTEFRRTATTVFLMLQAGWDELEGAERAEVRRLVTKSKGRPRNLTRQETKRLGQLAGRAARAAGGARVRRGGRGGT
jgi:hypothetical protein